MPATQRTIAVLTLLVTAIVLSGCNPPAAGRFEVSGATAEYQECFDVAFPFVPIFLAYRERADSVGLFFQSRGGSPQFTDTVHFEVFEPGTIETGVAYPTEAVVGMDTRIAATLDLSESCPAVGVLGVTTNQPAIAESPGIVGTITFDEFSQEIDGVIAGTVDAQLLDRNGEVMAQSFTGEFDFTVQVGQPYEEFRN